MPFFIVNSTRFTITFNEVVIAPNNVVPPNPPVVVGPFEETPVNITLTPPQANPFVLELEGEQVFINGEIPSLYTAHFEVEGAQVRFTEEDEPDVLYA